MCKQAVGLQEAEGLQKQAQLTDAQCPDKSNRHQLKHRKYHLNIKSRFYCFKCWNRLPREVVSLPSLEIFSTQLDTALGNLLRLALLGGAGAGPPPRPLVTSAVL